MKWGLAVIWPVILPSFEIKDLDRRTSILGKFLSPKMEYQNDIRLDFRSDLSGKRMISPTLIDQDVPISENLYHEIGQESSSVQLLVGM